jgi:hypothetical protein
VASPAVPALVTESMRVKVSARDLGVTCTCP